MSNSYYRMLNNKMAAKMAGDFISEIQKDLSSSVNMLNMDLYDFSKRLDSTNSIDMDMLLKYYAINQLLKTATKEECEASPQKPDINENFTDTPNKRIKKSIKDDLYYVLSDDGTLSPDSEITRVFDDGTYEKTEKRKMSLYKQKNVIMKKEPLLKFN